MTVYAPTSDYIWELVKYRGIDPTALFIQAGLDPASRHNINERISRRKFNHLIDLAAKASGDPAFGLRAA